MGEAEWAKNRLNMEKTTKKLLEAVEPMVKSELKKRRDASNEITQVVTGTNKLILHQPSVSKDGSKKRRTNYGITYDQLRAFSVSYPIARACINHRISQVTQLAWSITPREVVEDDDEVDAMREKSKDISEKLRFPTGKRTLTFRGFITQLVEDILVLDAAGIEKQQNLGGEIIGWRPFDASTIELLLHQDGSTPEPPVPAYQQKINGEITARLTTDDIYYKIMHPRTNTPYGLSPLETLVVTVTTALKLQSWNLSYLTSGNVPEGFVELPKDVASNPEQLAEWQAAWDAIFSGDPRYQRKLKFLPEGMKYSPTQKPEDMTFERFEKWLLLNTCAVFGVPPQSIGFDFDSNRAIAETQYEVGRERGLLPLSQFIKELFDEIVQVDMGEDEFEFTFLNLNPTNKFEEAKVFDILVRSGAMSIDEFRIGEGLRPIGVPHYIMTPIGPIFAQDLVEQSERGLDPAMPYTEAASPIKESGTSNNTSSQATTNPETLRDQKRRSATGVKSGSGGKDDKNKVTSKKNEAISDLKKWKKVAKNDLKIGRSYRSFDSNNIDYRSKELIKSSLGDARTNDDINKIFDLFISNDKEDLDDVKELYGRISKIINS